jgi:hypothetical protein
MEISRKPPTAKGAMSSPGQPFNRVWRTVR